jgi:hypothetical protein
MEQKGAPGRGSSTTNQSMLPLRLDPAWGALVGTFLLATCLAGPVGLALALIVWIVIEALRRGKNRGAGSSSKSDATDEFAARFRALEDDILQNNRQ